MTQEPQKTHDEAQERVAVSSTRLYDILRAETYWTAGIFHSWQEGRGAGAFRNSSIENVDGKFRSKSEAIMAAEKAIKSRMLYGVRQWDSAEPVASFRIPHETNEKLGSILDSMMSNDKIRHDAESAAPQTQKGNK